MYTLVSLFLPGNLSEKPASYCDLTDPFSHLSAEYLPTPREFRVGNLSPVGKRIVDSCFALT